MRNATVAFVVFVVACATALARDSRTTHPKKIDVAGRGVILLQHKTCRLGAVSVLSGLRQIALGDTLVSGSTSFTVGLIQVTEFNEDWSSGDVAYKKGDRTCVAAKDKATLPNGEDKCHALWAGITNCVPPD
jgi:hypothetical protein